MDEELGLSKELWGMLEIIKLRSIKPPANYPVEASENPIYEIEATNTNDIHLLKHLHHEGAISIESPGIAGFAINENTPRILYITLESGFKAIYKKYKDNFDNESSKKIEITLEKYGVDLVIESELGTFLLNKFKPGSDPEMVMNYLMNNSGRVHMFESVKFESGVNSYRISPTEFARKSGFKKGVLKNIIFNPIDKSKICLNKRVSTNKSILVEICKILTPYKST